MKYATTLFITLLCTAHSTYPMEEEEEKHNTQGIRPLFDPSDKAGMEHFNRFHKKMVNYTNGHVLSAAQTDEEYKNYLLGTQDYFKQLRHQCNEKGSEIYLTELIQHHEKKKSVLLQKSKRIFEEMENKDNNDQLRNQFEQAMGSLNTEDKIITELEHIQNRNRIMVIETFDSDNYDAASSSDSDSAVD